MSRRRFGQSVSDYVIAVGLVAATMATMQSFLQRYIQAKIKQSTDSMMSITALDATDPDPNTRGMATQRAGNDRRELNSGGIGGDPGVVAVAHSVTGQDMSEAVVGGVRVLSVDSPRTSTVIGQSTFQGHSQSFAQMGIQQDNHKHPWFRTEARKKKDAERWQAKQAKERADKAALKREAKQRELAWEYAKQQARACYANKKKQCLTGLTRDVMENPAKYAKWVKQWNKLHGKDPYAADPNDSAAAWEKLYGVKYTDAGTNWDGAEYESVPASWADAKGHTVAEALPYTAAVITGSAKTVMYGGAKMAGNGSPGST